MLKKRPPVITIMGHVDHGKTSLLDYIRHSHVVDREAGGITQHIGAYSIEYTAKNGEKKPLTFIDTPGHAAFSKMRERGADVTDLIVLVVAANDGVKPQTIESIRHIKTSGKPFVVAINKMDISGITADVAKSTLAEQGILVRSYGGEVDSIDISAKTGMGVDDLLDNLSVMADLLELQADDEAPLQAVVIESTLDAKRGPVASVIVKAGTLKTRQDVFAEDVEGRVRQLTDEAGIQHEAVLPGFPAEVVGLKSVPEVGSIIKELGREYSQAEPSDIDEKVAPTNPFADLNVDAFFNENKKLNLIIRSDVAGTLEVIEQNLDPDNVKIISSSVGQVTEKDIEMARATGAAIINFHNKLAGKIKDLAKTEKVKIRSYDVIYELIEDLQKQILKLMEPTIDEVELGRAEIVQIFEMRGQKIAGMKVVTGEIKRNDMLHLKRNGEIVANPVFNSMMHGKEEIQSVKAKNEFGATFKNRKLDFMVGDELVAYRIED